METAGYGSLLGYRPTLIVKEYRIVKELKYFIRLFMIGPYKQIQPLEEHLKKLSGNISQWSGKLNTLSWYIYSLSSKQQQTLADISITTLQSMVSVKIFSNSVWNLI